MKYIKSILLAGLGLMAGLGSLQAEKKALGHDDFDNWKSVRNQGISRDGNWSAYSVDPQEGDGVLTFYNTKTRKRIEIPRGYKAKFTADSRWGVALIKAEYAKTRKAKIAKKKDSELPQDSLAIVDLSAMTVTKVGQVTDYKIGRDGGDWIAFKSCDTTLIKPKQLKDKESGRPLIVANPRTKARKVLKWVNDYEFSKDGRNLAVTVKRPSKDSLTTDGVGVLLLPDTSYILVDRDKKFYGVPVFNEDGSKLAYTASDDTVKSGTKRASVYLSDLKSPMHTPVRLVTPSEVTIGGEKVAVAPNQYTTLKFSHNGRRLIAGVAPVIAPDDTTIVDFEQGKLDIWVWNREMTPPREQKMLERIQKKNFPVVYDLATMRQTLIAGDMTSDLGAFMAQVEAPDRWDGDWALITDPADKAVSFQWDYFAPVQMILMNVNTGERRSIGTFKRSHGSGLSPQDKYVAWFDNRQYYVYDIATGETRCVSEAVPYPLWNLDDRHPSPSEAYGIAGWSEGDNALLVYDKHDIWSLDPKGEKKPVCLTAGEGRKRNVSFRYHNLDPERRYLKNGDQMVFDVFDYTDKYNGLAVSTYGKPAAPAMEVLDGHAYTQLAKARNANVFTWQRANFSETPDIWASTNTKFAQAAKLSNANPQLKDYRWGTAQLERWYAYDGNPSEGVLYVPDDYDPAKKYPMLCVFYETGSEDLYRHYTMEPSWSWVNYPFYVSRGYVVFVPDIHYTSGRPGEDAYNYVCSGVEEMCRRYPWIDKDRIGIDGQSWGGYQTAYLVTRTNMFACAGSGAPVANMTSAYGGIRWESGDSRQAQYEQGQSRIGRTLWESPEFYIAASPVFHADRVNTPLLIMHNDADGAVPWYQGIEMFMALRRLEKPVWMLQYNGEAHNIRARKNRKDITKRLQQFFDHYLKGDPMPKWMKQGVPMVRKGQEFGFELEK